MQDTHQGPRENQDQLRANFREFFQVADDRLFDAIKHDLTFVSLQSGDVLVREGDRSDHLFFVVSGRLRALRRHGSDRAQVLGEIVRGETVGELALITGERRSATVVAVRDTLVARLSRATFESVLAGRPEVALAVMRTVINRFRRAEKTRRAPGARVTLCLLPVTGGLDIRPTADGLMRTIASFGGNVRLLTRREFEEFPRRVQDDPDPDGEVARWLDSAEAGTAALLLLADSGPTTWTAACIRRADEILLFADADMPPQVSTAETRYLEDDEVVVRPMQTLVLLHGTDKRSPSGTAAWLDRRTVARHLHIRPTREQDMRRLARIVTGRGIGIVLSGGGARGFAHVGVLNALAEAGVEIDVVGGTSIGSAIGGLRAMDLTGEALTNAARRIFVEHGNPTSDYNIFPLVSLVKGAKTRRITETAVQEVAGRDIGVEDSWTTYFCVAGNYSTATEAVLTRGSLSKALLASFAIPGALPPIIIEGHFFVDGGTVNNLPVDVMERYGLGRIIAVDLLTDRVRKVDLDWIPGTFALLADRLRPRAKRRYDLPSLPEMLLNASVLQSTGRQRDMRARADLCFRPRLNRVRLLDWHKFDSVVRDGYESAMQDLALVDPAEIARFR
jgi:NTE family protein